MNGTDYDVVIIGGGPAGSVAGINLARAGIKTAIIERKNFPRDTLCGEFLSFEVTNHLRELNLLEKFLLLKPNKINSFRLITQNNKVFNSDLPFDGYSLPRPVFDTFLLNEVKAAGAEIIQPAEVVGIDQENENPVLNIKTHIDCKNISANFIIGAYGKTNMLDKQLKRKFITRHSVYTGIKFHLSKENFSSICDSVIYIFSGNNIYCGVNTVNPDQVTICFLFKKNKIIKESPSELFQKLLIENRNFCSLFNDRININDHTLYGAGNIYFGKKELTYGKILMIGDAAGFNELKTCDGFQKLPLPTTGNSCYAQYFAGICGKGHI